MTTKYVFFDIDGTLWDRERRIPQSTARAIRQLHANGHKAFLNSGRSRANIHAPSLDALSFDGVVAACGNHVEFNGEILFERLFTDEQVENLIRILQQRRMPFLHEGPEFEWLNVEDFPDDPFAATIWEELGERYRRRRETLQRPYRINKFTADYYPSGDPDRASLHQLLEADYSYIDHGGACIEIIPKGSSKIDGVRFLQDHLQIPAEDIYAFGDGANDLEMIRGVAHGIAMAGGAPELLQAAEYVTTPLWENGIENGLRHYGLI